MRFSPFEAPVPQFDWRRKIALAQHVNITAHPCNCIGPQPGQTKCPCALHAERQQTAQMLRDGVVIDGRSYRLVPAEDAPA